MEKVRLKITTLTPVSVLSGVELSFRTDYVVKDKKLYIIDKKKMMDKVIAKNPDLVDTLVNQISSDYSAGKNSFSIEQFLVGNHIVEHIGEVATFIPEHNNFRGGSNEMVVKAIMKTPVGQPYIPGSSLKGAIKTALMDNWLEENDDKEKIRESILKPSKEKNEMNKLVSHFDYVEKKNPTMVMVHDKTIVQITDTTPFALESCIVVDTDRAGVPIRLETIKKGKSAEFELTLNDGMTWEKLKNSINSYSKRAVNAELYLLARLNLYETDYYHKLKDRISENHSFNSADNSAHLRIGFGKGFFYNSIGASLFEIIDLKDYDSDNFVEYNKYLRKTFRKKDSDFSLDKFPKSRLYISRTEEQLGWVKIERINE